MGLPIFSVKGKSRDGLFKHRMTRLEGIKYEHIAKINPPDYNQYKIKQTFFDHTDAFLGYRIP